MLSNPASFIKIEMNYSVENYNTSYRSVFKFEVENIAIPEVYAWMNSLRLLYQSRKFQGRGFSDIL